MANIHVVLDETIFFNINNQTFLETLHLEIRGTTISYFTYKNFERKQEKISGKRHERNWKNVSKDSVEELNNKKQELENIRKHKLHGHNIRSRARLIDGENHQVNFVN